MAPPLVRKPGNLRKLYEAHQSAVFCGQRFVCAAPTNAQAIQIAKGLNYYYKSHLLNKESF